jgi:hypothetical protein
MNRVVGVLLITFFILLGAILVIGSIKKWPRLTDPPIENWTSSSSSFIKKFFGKKVLLYFNYILGILLILLSLFAIWNEMHK